MQLWLQCAPIFPIHTHALVHPSPPVAPTHYLFASSLKHSLCPARVLITYTRFVRPGALQRPSDKVSMTPDASKEQHFLHLQLRRAHNYTPPRGKRTRAGYSELKDLIEKDRWPRYDFLRVLICFRMATRGRDQFNNVPSAASFGVFVRSNK